MNEHQKIVIIVIALFILALGLRINMISQDGFFEPDQSWEARMVKETLLYGTPNNPDTQAYFSVGYAPQTFVNPLWNISAFIYQATIGWWAGYNEEYFSKLMQLLPAIFGALTCVVLYFVGKAASNDNKIVGIITMLVGAVTPGFIYRGMMGAQETNAFGFLPITIGILFLILVFKRNKITRESVVLALLSGACFAFSVFSWSFYLIIPLFLLAFWTYRILNSFMWDKYIAGTQADLLHFIIIFSLFMGACSIKGFNWIQTAAAFMGIPSMALFIFAFVVIFVGSAVMYFGPSLSQDWRKVLNSSMIIGLILIVIGIWYFTTLNIDLRDLSSTGSMVGEESLGKDFFIQKFNIFNLLIPLGFISAIVLFIWKGRDYDFMPIVLSVFTITFIMGWLKLKFCYALGFGLAFSAIIVAILAYELWVYLKDNHKLEMKTIFIPAAAILIIGIVGAGIFIQDYNSMFTSDPALKNVVIYLNENAPNAKVMNSWGIGHVLSYSGAVVLADNRNYSAVANAQFARFENDTNAADMYKMVRDINADYVLVQSNDFYALRSNAFYIANKVDDSIGREFTKGVINILDCSRDGNELVCPNSGRINIAANSIWTTTPYDFYNGKDPIYVYAVGSKVYVLNVAANNTNLAKVLVGTPETKAYYEKVFESGSYILFKVNKDLKGY